MQIQINSDSNIKIHETTAAPLREKVAQTLSRFSDHITRIEVHLSDENADKGGQNDKRCMMEARLEGRQPMAVSATASSLDQAIDDAADKLARMIESTLGRAER